MELTSFQNPQIRDSNDNIIQDGAYGKYSAFANIQNTGILDYINNNLQVHDNLINLLLASSSEYTDISSINDTLTNVINLAGGKQDRLIAGDNITIDGNVISSVGGGDVTKEEFEDLKRSNDALWKLTQGIAWDFETSTDEAYTKQIPSGAKCFDLKMLGGKSVVANQLQQMKMGTTSNNGITFTVNAEKTEITINGTATGLSYVAEGVDVIKGHKYFIKGCAKGGSTSTYMSYIVNSSMFNTSNAYYDVGNGNLITCLQSGKANYVYARVESGVTVTNLVFKPQCVDLTQMFGAGNEPTLEQCQQIFTEYIPYTEPTLVNHKITDVVVRGKNLFPNELPNNLLAGTLNADGVKSATNARIFTIKCKPNTDYIFSQKVLGLYGMAVAFTNKEQLSIGDIVDFKGNMKNRLTWQLNSGNNEYIALSIENLSTFALLKDNEIQIEQGTVATSYSPYTEQTKQVPQAIRDIEGNGWSAGTVRNYVDTERKKFGKRINRVDLGTLNWVYGASVDSASGIYTMRASGISNLKTVSDTKVIANILCDKYVAITGDNAYRKVNGVGMLTNGTLSIYDENYNTSSSPSAFKSAMSGVYLYYEMEEPQEIDIDLDNRFSAILCEGNGSITFEGSTDYKLPIANTEEFLVKLSEV